MIDEEKMPARPDDPWADYVSDKLRELSRGLAENKERLAENTALTQDTRSSIYELMAIVQMGRGFFHFCQSTGNWIRRIAKWVAPIITAAAGIYAFFHDWGQGK